MTYGHSGDSEVGVTVGFKILLTENASPVGAALFKSLENYPHPVLCPEFGLQDWFDEKRVRELLESSGPAVVINPLHYFEPLVAEEELRFYSVLASICAQRDLTVIHLSSAQVFGRAQLTGGAANESVEPAPDTSIGEALRKTELAFGEVRRAIILRLPWLLDSGESGMINEACRVLCGTEVVSASEQWRVAPIYVSDVVRAVIAMLQQTLCGAENWGIFHLHSSDVCSEAEFVDCVARNLSKLNVPTAPIVATGGGERLFSGNGWLQGNRCTNDFGIQRRSWRKGIKSKIQAWIAAEVEAARLTTPEEN